MAAAHALRERIARIERSGAADRPSRTIPPGIPAIDQALPGGGLATNIVQPGGPDRLADQRDEGIEDQEGGNLRHEGSAHGSESRIEAALFPTVKLGYWSPPIRSPEDAGKHHGRQ